MPFVSVTRLRLRSIRFLPPFARHAFRSLGQLKRAPGFRGGALLADRHRTFWTMTAWDSFDSMRGYMMGGDHRTAMPHLVGWCDEASVVHWDQDDDAMPSWSDADQRMRLEGRPSKIRFPSPNHARLAYDAPRVSFVGPIRRTATR